MTKPIVILSAFKLEVSQKILRIMQNLIEIFCYRLSMTKSANAQNHLDISAASLPQYDNKMTWQNKEVFRFFTKPQYDKAMNDNMTTATRNQKKAKKSKNPLKIKKS